MPYRNMPRSKWPAMERCVTKLRRKGGVKSVYAVCYASVMGTRKKGKKKK